MNWGSPEFVIALVGMSMVGWVITTWIRAKHGYPLEDEWGGKTVPRDSDAAHKLTRQNRELIEKMEAMQDRMIVLERIVTDKGYTVAEEIEALREDNGVPLNLQTKERT